MTSVFSLVGECLLQGAVERGLLERVSTTASAIMTIALLILTIVATPVAWRLWKTYSKVDHLLERVHDDLAPILANAHDISDNLNFITTAVRTDVARLNETINSANERLKRAMALSERRVNEFNALLSIVQQEAEGVFVSTASTVRGVRRGAASFQERSGPDFASDELDAAELADDLDIQEDNDGYDSTNESPAGEESAAPRVRPRPRVPRRA